MFIFPSMLVPAAEKAGMKVPPKPDDFKTAEFPHFRVFCQLQLCRPMQPGEHWENAKIIAAIPEKELKTLRLQGFLKKGLRYSQ